MKENRVESSSVVGEKKGGKKEEGRKGDRGWVKGKKGRKKERTKEENQQSKEE